MTTTILVEHDDSSPALLLDVDGRYWRVTIHGSEGDMALDLVYPSHDGSGNLEDLEAHGCAVGVWGREGITLHPVTSYGDDPAENIRYINGYDEYGASRDGWVLL